jgi:hypothetical protein
MTNADGNAGETAPSDPGSQPSEPLSSGYEAPPIEHSQDRPDPGAAQPPYEFPSPNSDVAAPYPPAIDYPADIPYGYAPPPAYPPSFPPPPGYPPPPPGYGMSGYPGYPGGYGMPPANPTNSMAIGSLVASGLSLFLLFACAIGLVAALVGIGLGIVALNQIKQTGQSGYGPQVEQPGRGLAIAGIALGVFGTLINGGWLLFFVIGVLSA